MTQSNEEFVQKTRPRPIVISLGSCAKDDIKDLENGEGTLTKRVKNCIEDLRTRGKVDESAQLVIVVAKEKKSKKRGLLDLMYPTPYFYR